MRLSQEPLNGYCVRFAPICFALATPVALVHQHVEAGKRRQESCWVEGTSSQTCGEFGKEQENLILECCMIFLLPSSS